MGLFDFMRKEEEEVETRETLEEVLLQAGILTDDITVKKALNIPSVASCVDLISKTVAMLPVKLYKEQDNGVAEVLGDNRVKLLNDDTKDTLDGFQFKKAIIEDYLLSGAGYSYINRKRNDISSLHYVDSSQVAVNINSDPIFKDYDIMVHGANYRPFEFIKLTRKTKDGVTGKGIVAENRDVLAVAYNSLQYENTLVKTGGNKKGFLKSQAKLSEDAIRALKRAWNNLYKNNTENVVVLNQGLDFQEASNTSVELQLNENKKTNSTEICKLFNVPPSLLDGSATDEEYNNFIKLAILPILEAFENAINKDLLLESEKDSLYFDFDTKDLMKGDMEKRYKAFNEAVKAGWITKNEIRYIEDLPSIKGLDVVTMSLGDVIFDTEKNTYFTPNMDAITDTNEKSVITQSDNKEVNLEEVTQ